MLRPHEPDVIVGFRRIGRIERDRFSEEVGRLVVKAGLVRGGAVIKIEPRVQHFVVRDLGFVQGFLESDDRLLRLFGFPQRNGEEVGELRESGKTLPRFGENFDGAFAFFERPDEQFRQAQGRCWRGPD